MDTIKALCNYFHNMHNGFSAELNELESYNGCYRVYITDEEYGLSNEYIFESADEFKTWIDGVVLC